MENVRISKYKTNIYGQLFSRPSGGTLTFTATPEGFFNITSGVNHYTQGRPRIIDENLSDDLYVTENTTGQERTGVLSVSGVTNVTEGYEGVATIYCAWTITQEAGTTPPPPEPQVEPCTFNFVLTGLSFVSNSTSEYVEFQDDGYNDSFTMTAPGGDALNAGFNAYVEPWVQHRDLTVTNLGAGFIVYFDGTEASKDMQVNYDFQGTKQSYQQVYFSAKFINLSTQEEKTVSFAEGSGAYTYLNLEDWYTPNGNLYIQVTFDILVQ